MEIPFFIKLLELSAMHGAKNREGFQRLNLSDGVPKIIFIVERNNGLTQKELAEACKIRESTMTVLLNKMETMGIIYKKKDFVSGGKRAFRIYLTEDGKELSKKVDELVASVDKQCLKGFSETEVDNLFSYMDRITNNLKNM